MSVKTRRLVPAICLALSILGGCTQTALRVTTRQQSRTLADLQYQQVLDNLAMFSANPFALPFFATPTGGTNGVSDAAMGGATLNYDRAGFMGWGLNFGGSRNVSENWTLTPVNDPARLRRMRCAYQIALGIRPLPSSLGCDADCDNCTKLLQEMGVLSNDACSWTCDCDPACSKLPPDQQQKQIKKMQDQCTNPATPVGYAQSLACNIPMGWICKGGYWDVPRHAPYVGHSCGNYVWVRPDGMDQLTRFTLTILALATGDPPDPNATVESTLDPQGNVTGYKVTTKQNVAITPIPTADHAAIQRQRSQALALLDNVNPALKADPRFRALYEVANAPAPQYRITPISPPVSPRNQDAQYSDPIRGLIQLNLQRPR